MKRLNVNAASICWCHKTEAKYWNSLFSTMNVLMNLQRAAEWRVRLTLKTAGEERRKNKKKGFEKKNSLTNTQTQNFRSAIFLNHILWKNISTWFAPTFTIISFKSHTHTNIGSPAHTPLSLWWFQMKIRTLSHWYLIREWFAQKCDNVSDWTRVQTGNLSQPEQVGLIGCRPTAVRLNAMHLAQEDVYISIVFLPTKWDG